MEKSCTTISVCARHTEMLTVRTEEATEIGRRQQDACKLQHEKEAKKLLEFSSLTMAMAMAAAATSLPRARHANDRQETLPGAGVVVARCVLVCVCCVVQEAAQVRARIRV